MGQGGNQCTDRFVRRFALVSAGVLVLPVVLAACGGPDGPPKQARDAAAGFVTAWSAGKTGASVDPRTAKAATAAREDATERLDISRTTVRPSGALTCVDDDQANEANEGRGVCRQQVSVSHDLAGLGTWRYATTVEVRENADGAWKVWWTPATFHPRLTAATRFDRHRELPPRASILDHQGQPLTEDRPVVRVGVEPRKVKPDVTYAELGRYLGIDTGKLRTRVEAAQPTHFVDAITLREEAYEPVAGDLEDIPGVVTQKDTMSLAPSSAYARAVLGVVAPATAETLEAAGPLAMAGDELGASGLQRAYQSQLAGQPGGTVELVDAQGDEPVATLLDRPVRPGKPLQTTLDPMVQEAAEHAVEGQDKPTAIVAVRASTGAVLAAANGPGTTSYNRAFVRTTRPARRSRSSRSRPCSTDGLTLSDR